MNAIAVRSEAPVLIMAGGTGGHVFPALAVAQSLARRGVPVVWLGTRAGLESRVVPAAGFPVCWVRVQGLRGKGWRRRLGAPFMLLGGLAEALAALARLRPRSVLGMGGFVAGPGGLAAWLLRRPLLIHEQNAVAGFTNRLLAPLARCVLTAFPASFPGHPRARLTGNPVRPEITAVPPPEQRLAGRTGPVRLLVLGGSLGAEAINTLLPEWLAGLPPAQRPEVRHQAGRAHCDRTRARYQAAGVRAKVEPFIEDMAAAYGWADLVLCRAGALTLAELCAAGVGSILVPYPHAVDDHQSRNAAYLAQAGAARVLPQAGLDAAQLATVLGPLLQDAGQRLAMARAARRLGRPQATDEVAQLCLDVAEGYRCRH